MPDIILPEAAQAFLLEIIEKIQPAGRKIMKGFIYFLVTNNPQQQEYSNTEIVVICRTCLDKFNFFDGKIDQKLINEHRCNKIVVAQPEWWK